MTTQHDSMSALEPSGQPPTPGDAAAPCCRFALARALGEFRHSVSGRVVDGSVTLRGTVRTPEIRHRIEQAVRQLACVVDVANDVKIAPILTASSARHALPRAGHSQPLLYLSDYCTLERHALEQLIYKSLALLAPQSDAVSPIARVIVFYYLWQEEAAMIDVAVPAARALDRRPNGRVRGTILPHVGRWTHAKGGVAGLAAARQRLARRCNKDPADPFFRVWQSITLRSGRLPQDWPETPLQTESCTPEQH
tara:strand:- start:7819 stop:8574 length:756 start_codon:yes stop_codon:yes gene_type:complete